MQINKWSFLTIPMQDHPLTQTLNTIMKNGTKLKEDFLVVIPRSQKSRGKKKICNH
jgi:hypothetical protein